MNFLSYKIIWAAKNLKNGPVPYLGLEFTINVTHKPNPSRETVPLNHREIGGQKQKAQQANRTFAGVSIGLGLLKKEEKLEAKNEKSRETLPLKLVIG